MKKLLKTMLILGVVCCLAVSGTAFADANLGHAGDNAATRSMYYLSGSLGFSNGSNYVGVIVSTSAFTYVDKIYHDVTIYKNGSLYSSKRYSSTNCQTYTNQINVPAVSGDVITVYVTHYTSHNGVTESGNTSNSHIR